MKRLFILSAALALAAPAWADTSEGVVLVDAELDAIVAGNGSNGGHGGRSVSCRGNCNVSPVTVIQGSTAATSQKAKGNAGVVTQGAINVSANVALFSVDIRQRNGIVRLGRGTPAS